VIPISGTHRNEAREWRFVLRLCKETDMKMENGSTCMKLGIVSEACSHCRKKESLSYTQNKKHGKIRRGRYVEFNLVHKALYLV
jgi:coproporphyrinogen III oxidase